MGKYKRFIITSLLVLSTTSTALAKDLERLHISYQPTKPQAVSEPLSFQPSVINSPDLGTFKEKMTSGFENFVEDFSNLLNRFRDTGGSGTLSFYCACPICCGNKSVFITADGTHVWNGMDDPYIVAANWLPLGTKVLINGVEYTVRDTGSAKRLSNIGTFDVFVPAGHETALNLGLKRGVTVDIVY